MQEASGDPSTSSSVNDHSCGFVLRNRVPATSPSACSADLQLANACMDGFDGLDDVESALTDVPTGLLELLAAEPLPGGPPLFPFYGEC